MILPKRKGGALSRKVSELSLSPKEGWRRIKRNLYAKVHRPKKRASSWEEGLSSLPEGKWAVAATQRGMMQRMKGMTTRQTKGIEKERINILFDAMQCMRKIFNSRVKTYKNSYKLLILSRVSCSDDFLSNV